MRFVLLALLCAACRSSDGRANSAPARADSAALLSDSARAEAMLVRADLGRIQGDSAAKVWMVEISDFQCPFCKKWHEETYPVLQREFIQTGRVRMAYINLPLQQHEHAQQAAEAAMCAGAQSRFWQMHDALFNSQERWAPMPLPTVSRFFDSLAVSVGVKRDEWLECARGPHIARIIGGDRGRSVQAGVRSTPTFLVGNLRIEGAQPIEVFRAAIEQVSATEPPKP
jgi:protein-disulfide isomerase